MDTARQNECSNKEIIYLHIDTHTDTNVYIRARVSVCVLFTKEKEK